MKLYIWIVVISIMMMIGKQFEPNTKVVGENCSYRSVHNPKPAPDVLFMGSSAIANSIDPIYIENYLTKKLGKEIQVEYLFDFSYGPHKFAVTLQEFVKRRGSPKIIVYHMPFPSKRWGIFAQTELYEIKTLKKSALNDQITVQAAFSDAYERNPLLNLSAKDWTSVPEIITFRLSDFVYRFFENTVHSVTDTPIVRKCKNNVHWRKVLPKGRIDPNVDYRQKNWVHTIGKPMQKKVIKRHKKRFPIDFSLAIDRESIKVARYMAATQTDVEKFYVTFIPHFGVPKPFKSDKDLNDRLGDKIEYISSYQAFDRPDEAVFFKKYFRDGNHVNINGAEKISMFWASVLEEEL